MSWFMHSFCLDFWQQLMKLLLVKFSWKVGGNLIASIKDLLISVLEPDTGHTVLLSILLHSTDINLILSVHTVHLFENTGHVSNLSLLLLKHMLDLLLESVVKSKSISISSPL